MYPLSMQNLFMGTSFSYGLLVLRFSGYILVAIYKASSLLSTTSSGVYIFLGNHWHIILKKAITFRSKLQSWTSTTALNSFVSLHPSITTWPMKLSWTTISNTITNWTLCYFAISPLDPSGLKICFIIPNKLRDILAASLSRSGLYCSLSPWTTRIEPRNVPPALPSSSDPQIDRLSLPVLWGDV